MGLPKFAEFANITEKKFALLKIERVSYPNDQHLFTLRPTTGAQELVSITASPAALAAELRRVADWLDETA